MPNEEELQDSPTPDADETVDESQDLETTPEASDDVEKLKTTNSKLYARLKKTEAENKQLKSQTEVKEQPSKPNPSPSDDEWKARIELKTDGYTSQEVDAIMQLGGPKAVGNPIVQEAIASMRKRAKSEAATPSDTAKSPVYKKYTQDELDAMSSTELEKILPHA
jgi:hypothetical protein